MTQDNFGKHYAPQVSKETADIIYDIKSKAEELLDQISFGANRELSLAKTKLEECVMWAVKAAIILDTFKHSTEK
jgi:hypothetical protein